MEAHPQTSCSKQTESAKPRVMQPDPKLHFTANLKLPSCWAKGRKKLHVGPETHPIQHQKPRDLALLLNNWHQAWNATKIQLAQRKLVITRTKTVVSRLTVAARAAVKSPSRARKQHIRAKTDTTREQSRRERQAAKSAIRYGNAAIVQKRREEAGKNI